MTRHTIHKKVGHEPPSQRRHHRMTTPLWVSIEDVEYKTLDWSISGFRIEKFHRQATVGEEIDAYLIVNFQDFYINFDVKAKVARYVGENLAFSFDDDIDKHKEILQYITEKNITGEVINVDDMFRHIDIPMSKTNLKPDFDKQLAEKNAEHGSKRKIYLSLYLSFGLALFFYLTVMLYSYFMTIRVESAVVDAPIEAMMAIENGLLAELYGDAGSWVKTGDPLYRLYEPKITLELDKQKIAVDEAILRRDYIKMLIEAEQARVELYRTVSEKKEEAYQQQTKNLQDKFELFKNKLKRTINMRKNGYLSDEDLDQATHEFIASQNEMLINNNILDIERISQKSLELGNYFNDGKIEGELSNLLAEYEKTRQEVKFQFDKLKATQRYYEQLVFKAPYAGRVIKYVSPIGSSVDKGDPVLLLERNEDRVVSAYLTQNEVIDVGLGEQVTLYMPALNIRIKGEVFQIDRTSGFIDEMEQQYRWRGEGDRSALVLIKMQEFSQDEIRQHVPNGTPVIVYIKRRMANGAIDRFVNFFMG